MSLTGRTLLLAALLVACVARPGPPHEGVAPPAPVEGHPPAGALSGAAAVHQPFVWSARTVLSLLLSLLVSALSNAAGVGGGAIFVPLFNSLLGFPIKTATALSQAVITGGALGSVAYSLARRHPHAPNRTLVDFDLALTLAPPLLLGVGVGVLLNIALPSWLITLLLIPVLLLLTWRTASTGLRMRRAEQQAQAQHAATLEAASSLPAPAPARSGKLLQPLPPPLDGQRLAGPEPADWQIAAGAGPAPPLAVPAPLQHPGLAKPSAAADAEQQWQWQRGLSAVLRVEPTMSCELTPRAGPGLPARHEGHAAVGGSGTATGGSSPSGRGHQPTESATSSCRSGSASSVVGDHEDSEDERQEEGAVVLSAGSSSALARFLSSPGLLDGVLEPGTARASPLPASRPPCPQGSRDAQLRGSPQPSLDRRHGPGQWHWQQLAQHPAGIPVKALGGGAVVHVHSTAGAAQATFVEQAPPLLRLPWLRLAELLALWGAFFAFQLGKERFSRCSWQYAVLLGSQAALALGVTVLFGWQTCRGLAAAQRQVGEGEPILPARTPLSSSTDGGTKPGLSAAGTGCADGIAGGTACGGPGWSHRQLAAASAVCLAGGCLAGTLGIGGGMVMAPLFLELGVHPQAASATSGLLVLFSASSAVLSFAAAGRLNLQYAAVFGCACMVSAFLGTFLVGRAVRRSGRASLLVLILAAVVGLGAAATTVFGGRYAIQELVSGVGAVPDAPFCN